MNECNKYDNFRDSKKKHMAYSNEKHMAVCKLATEHLTNPFNNRSEQKTIHK